MSISIMTDMGHDIYPLTWVYTTVYYYYYCRYIREHQSNHHWKQIAGRGIRRKGSRNGAFCPFYVALDTHYIRTKLYIHTHALYTYTSTYFA